MILLKFGVTIELHHMRDVKYTTFSLLISRICLFVVYSRHRHHDLNERLENQRGKLSPSKILSSRRVVLTRILAPALIETRPQSPSIRHRTRHSIGQFVDST